MRPPAISALGRQFGIANDIGTAAGVAVRERSDIAAVLISACLDGCETAISAILGVDLPSEPGRLQTGKGMTAIWLTPRSWIVQCGVEDETRIQDDVVAAYPDGTVHATGFTDHLCWLELAGGDPLQLLCRGAFVSLDPAGLAVGRSRRTIVADVAAIVLRPEANRLLVGVERSRARFFSDWLLRAQHEFADPAHAG